MMHARDDNERKQMRKSLVAGVAVTVEVEDGLLLQC